MFGYYLYLALRSLRDNLALTTLMIVTIGVGIGAFMTTLTIYRAMSADPIPEKSAQLFTPQIDNFGPAIPASVKRFMASDRLPDRLTYTDAIALMHARAAQRQTAMYATTVSVSVPDSQQLPIQVSTRATYRDFFAMFDVPFEYGAPWSVAEDADASPVLVLTRKLSDQLFHGADSVGRTLLIDKATYRVAGVIADWDPSPHFYDMDAHFGGAEQLFLPFTLAISRQMQRDGMDQCLKPPGSDFNAYLHSECVWISAWVELPTAQAVRTYRSFLRRYADEQRENGRFDWPAHVALRDVQQWLAYKHVVSSDVRLLVWVSLAFLLVCLLNALGLMLAKFMGRTPTVTVRRMMGANQSAILAQGLVEVGAVGVAGATVGLGIALFGLLVAGDVLPSQDLGMTHLNAFDVGIAVIFSVGATMLMGLYPALQASQRPAGWQIKVQ